MVQSPGGPRCETSDPYGRRMWTALVVVVLFVTAGVAFVARAALQDVLRDAPEDELWRGDATWWP